MIFFLGDTPYESEVERKKSCFMQLSMLQMILMAVTIALALGGGIYAARSVHSAEGYSLGGQSAGVPMVAGTIAGTCIGGGATVGTAQLAGTVGLSAWWFTIGTGLALVIMGLFYAKPLRGTALETIAQYLVLNYGKGAGQFTTVVSSLGIFFSAVASCLPGIAILAALTGMPSYLAALALTALVACYGFWGSLFIAGILAWRSISGDAAVAALLPAFPWFSLIGNGVQNALVSVFSLLVGVLCTQSYIQAVFSASNPRTASVGAFTAALITIPVGLPCALIGMYMHAAHPEVAPLLALPTYLLTEAPAVLGSIAMGGILLSLVGSIAGLSLGIGTMLTRGIFAKLFHTDGAASELRLSRCVVLGVILAACAFSLANEGSQVLFWNYLSMALRGGGIFLPLTVAVFRPHAVSARVALASMILSTATAVVAAAMHTSISPLFIGLGVSALTLVPGFFGHHDDGDEEPVLAE